MKVTTMYSTTHTATLDDGTELALDFEPVGYPDPIVTELDNYIVISYNTYDDSHDVGNPFIESGEFEWEDVGRFWYSPYDAGESARDALDEAWSEMEEDRLLDAGEIESRWDFDGVPPEWGEDILFQVFSQSPTEYRYAFHANMETAQPWIRLANADDFHHVQRILTIPVESVPGMTKEQVDAMVNAMLDSFRSWMVGEVYGCVTRVYSSHGGLVEDETVWGYVGDEHAQESLDEQHKAMVNWLKNQEEEN